MFMRKLIVFLSMMFFVMNGAFAQKGIQAVGAHLGYGTEIGSIGIGVKYQYNITDNIRLEPSVNYFFENDGVDMFDINANAHYLFPMSNNIRVYPLAGFTYSRWSANAGDGWEVSKSKFGLNLGGGAECDISDNLMMNIELKYQLISKFDQTVVSIGLAYMF